MDFEQYDECDIKFECLKTSMEIFYQSYNNYMNIRTEDVIVKNKFDHDAYRDLINSVSQLESQIIMIRKSLEKKLEETYSEFLSIKCKNHKNIPNDIISLKNTLNRLYEYIEKRIKENKHKIEYYADVYISYEYESSEKKLEEEKNSPNYFIYQDNISEPRNYYNEECSYTQLQMEIERQKEYEGDKETYQKIIEVKNQIAELTKTIQTESQKGSQSLMEIERSVDTCDTNVERSNEQLRQAALLKNKSNTIKYPLALGTILGAAGTIVPGIGNIIGLSVGTGIGYAVAKLEKKAIRKIEPEKYKK
jgi:hypothetical protein